MSSVVYRWIGLNISLVAIFWIVIPFAGNAQLVEMNLKFRQDTIRIGEQNQLELEIIKHKNVVLGNFPLLDSLNKEFEILDSLRISSPDSLILKYRLTSFKAGKYLVPSIPLIFIYENNVDTIFSSELLLTVVSPLVDNQAEIRDIKPPLNLPFRLREIIPETGIVIAILLVLMTLIIYFVRRLHKKNILQKEERILPPHIIALRDLDHLKEEKLWQKGKIKEYYSRLADIMRIYLEKRFSIPAMEFVSTETLQSFRKIMPHEEILTGMLEGILETSDFVKFAKGDPLPAENQGNMDNAYLFIGQTKIEEDLVANENDSVSLNESEKDKTLME